MALLDPTDQARNAREAHKPTTHPRLCLLGGFGFIVAAALTVHVLFSLLG